MGEAKLRALRGEAPKPSKSSAERAARVLAERRARAVPMVDVMTRQRQRAATRRAIKAIRPR